MIVNTKNQLYQYIDKIELQRTELAKSKLFEPTEIVRLDEVYNELQTLAQRKLNRLNGVQEAKEKTKLHTLVFYSDPAKKNIFIAKYCDHKQFLESATIPAFKIHSAYIENHVGVIISKAEKTEIKYLEALLCNDFILVPNKRNPGTRKIHTLPIVVGCNFSIELLPESLRNHCNIVEL